MLRTNAKHLVNVFHVCANVHSIDTGSAVCWWIQPTQYWPGNKQNYWLTYNAHRWNNMAHKIVACNIVHCCGLASTIVTQQSQNLILVKSQWQILDGYLTRFVHLQSQHRHLSCRDRRYRLSTITTSNAINTLYTNLGQIINVYCHSSMRGFWLKMTIVYKQHSTPIKTFNKSKLLIHNKISNIYAESTRTAHDADLGQWVSEHWLPAGPPP